MSSIPLMLSAPSPCSYFEDKKSQSAFVDPNKILNPSLYSKLLEHGFRRSGDHVYSPHCADCSQCVACRIPVSEFKPNRNQKRCLKKNQHLTTDIKPVIFEQAHYELYMRYQQHKHPESSMVNSSEEDYIDFLSCSWGDARFVEFRHEGQLAAVGVVDFFKNSLSAVYTFFEPTMLANSLGVYAVLWQIEHARQLGLEHVYLGYWIEGCQKMAYKNQYQPLEGYINRHWELIAKS